MTSPQMAIRSFRAIGTTVLLAVTDHAAADVAADMVRSELRRLDEACSRFREDAEIASLGSRPGVPVVVSNLLFDVVTTACEVAALTAGAVDPTVGAALEDLGYDRDFRLLADPAVNALGAAEAAPSYGGEAAPSPRPAPGWWTITIDPERRTVALPAGVRLDVGSSAKALAADRAAAHVASRLATGVLVDLGGDIAVSGEPPRGGWRIGIAHESSAPVDKVDEVVSVPSGGVASSAPEARAWRAGGRPHHHIIDPWTGESASLEWTLVSVMAPTCVEANALSTASIVWGADAVDRLAGYGRPARLVRVDGQVLVINGWPPGDESQEQVLAGRVAMR